jgi:hypothetical protein
MSVSTFFNVAFINFVETAKQISPDMRQRLLTSIRFLKQNKIFILFENTSDKYTILLKTLRGQKVGDFVIFRNNSDLLMYIYVDDEYLNGGLRNQGLSRLMIAAMIFQMEATNPFRRDQLFFIDLDSSYENGSSFWEHIGMKFCRFDEAKRSGIRQTKLTGSGAEKVITYSDLSQWALGVPNGDNQIITRQF